MNRQQRPPQRYNKPYNKPYDKRKNEYKFSDIVYFHANIIPNDQSTTVRCIGTIVRVPNDNRGLYKILITGVAPHNQPSHKNGYSLLLGKKFTRGPQQLSRKPPDWWDMEGQWKYLNQTKQLETVNRFKSIYRYY